MNLEAFHNGSSLFHRMNTRVKLTVASLFALVCAVSTSLHTITLALFFAMVLVVVARLNWLQVLKRLALVNGFILFLWATLPLTYPGKEAYSILFFSVSVEGMIMALLITLKTNSIVLACIALLATSTITALGYGMQKMFIPKKLCLLLLFSYRYIIVIFQEFKRLNRAARIRCFTPKTNVHTYRTFGYLFGMTLVKSWQRAERVNDAMVLRGFDGTFHSLNEQLMSPKDLIIGFFIMAIPVMLAGLDIWY